MNDIETHHYNTSWEKIRRVFPSGEKLAMLDLGCGDGRILKHLVGTHDVYGIDSSHEAVRAAYAAGINAVKGDITNFFPFRDRQFDVVLALDILEHIADLGFLFKEMKRVLKPDGCLIVSLPNHFDLRTRLDVLLGRGIIKWSQRAHEKRAWTYSHIRFLTLGETDAMLREHGFYAEVWQFNFMSAGLLPTRFAPVPVRRFLVRQWPNAWSGKFVVRCRLQPTEEAATIIVDRTPSDF